MSPEQQEIERLKAALQAIDDHGRALSFIETLKEKDAEIELLRSMVIDRESEIESLEKEINRMEGNY